MTELEQPRRSKKILITTALLCGLLAGIPVQGQAPGASPGQPALQNVPPAVPSNLNPEEVVMAMGDYKITVAEFETLLKNLPPQYSDSVRVMGKKGFADQYAYLLAMAAEGEKLKIDQREDVRLMIAFQRLLALAQTTLNELAVQSVAVTSEEVQAYYSSHQREFEEEKLRGIYVSFAPEAATSSTEAIGPDETERPKRSEADARAKAEALRNRILGGEDMANLAKKESDHPTAPQGGDFGYVHRNQFAPQVENVVFSLALKEVSSPIRDRFGYFIFTVESKRIQPLEQAKQAIENGLRQQKVVAILERVRKDHPVTFNPRYFPETPVAPPPASPPR